MIKLTTDEVSQIREAIEEVENLTSAEIVTAVIEESNVYAFHELRFSVVCGFVWALLSVVFADTFSAWLGSFFWGASERLIQMELAFSPFIVIALFYALSNLPVLDRLVVPRSFMLRKVRERAGLYFLESGMASTRHHTGLLIYISCLERRVELITDTGISLKIDSESWTPVVDHIVQGIRKKQLAQSLSEGIRQCGEMLLPHFPHLDDDENELRDDIRILGK